MRIETERLYLRPVTMEDAPFIQQHFGQPDVLEYLPPEVPNPYPADGAAFYLGQIILPSMEAKRAMEFMIHRKEDDAPIGAVMVEQKDAATGEWRRGFWMASEFRGNRYMEEASLSALRWLFAHTDAARVVTGNAPSNRASARIKEKQGFLPLGLRVQMPPFHNGETQAEYWQMTRERFEQLHGIVEVL